MNLVKMMPTAIQMKAVRKSSKRMVVRGNTNAWFRRIVKSKRRIAKMVKPGGLPMVKMVRMVKMVNGKW